MQVGCDDGVEAFGIQCHPHRHGIDKHLVPTHIGELCGNLGRDLVPHHHAVPLGVGFGHHGQQLARARLRQAKGKPHDAGDAHTRENGGLCRHFLRQAAMRTPAMAGIFPFRILADNHPVQITGPLVPEGG